MVDEIKKQIRPLDFADRDWVLGGMVADLDSPEE